MKAKKVRRSNRVASNEMLERITLVRVDRFDWKTAALCIGEHLSDQGPNGYYQMNPEEWMEWAKAAIEKMRSNKA